MVARQPATRQAPEGGFTLVELLVAISLLGIVMAPLAMGMFIGFRTMNDTSNRLLGSSDAQFLSIYLPVDVKSADSGVTSSITCTGATNPVLKLTSDAEANVAGELASAAVVVYWVKTVTGGFQLVRSICTSGAKTGDIVVARDLASASSAVASVIDASKGFSLKVTEKKLTTEPAAYVFTVSGRFRTGITT